MVRKQEEKEDEEPLTKALREEASRILVRSLEKEEKWIPLLLKNSCTTMENEGFKFDFWRNKEISDAILLPKGIG